VAAAPAPTAPAQDKKVCRRESVMGSIMPKRTCRTASEWSAIDQANRAIADQALSNRRSNAAQ
jgi:hypothetical protein